MGKPWNLPPAAAYHGCLNCRPMPKELGLSSSLDVGFGFVELVRDGRPVRCFHSRVQGHGYFLRFQRKIPQRARWAERKAAKEPSHDWRLVYTGPMSTSTYQRQGRKRWVLVETGMGFA